MKNDTRKSNCTPEEEWLSTKIKKDYPDCREKAVLVELSNHARTLEARAWCSIATIAHNLGISKRTVKRHIRALALRRDIELTCAVKDRIRTNRYRIVLEDAPVALCEAVTRVSRRQMRLPLVNPDRRSRLEKLGVRKSHWGTDTVSLGAVTPCHSNPILKPNEKGISINFLGKREGMPEERRTSATDTIIANMLADLRRKADEPMPQMREVVASWAVTALTEIEEGAA